MESLKEFLFSNVKGLQPFLVFYKNILSE